MRLAKTDGYSLIELIVVLVIIGILTSVALKSLTSVNRTARYEETKSELDKIAIAIVGDQKLLSGGSRIDFGYVGDVGAFPANLDALITNPGGYATWNGPYINDPFSTDGSSTLFKLDAWGGAYSYSGGLTIVSSGGPTTITRELAVSTASLLYNPVSATITDLNNTPPGTTYKDSVRVLLSYPNGTGGTITTTSYPGADGFIQFDSIPVGNHLLQTIYMPTSDTLTRRVTINTGERYYANITLYSDYWTGSGGGGSGIEYVSGTIGFDGGDCEEVTFNITNTSSSNITLTNMTVSWSTPNTWYDKIKFNGSDIWNQNSPSNATGDVATFSSPQVISAGQTITVIIKDFEDQNDGNGNDVDMNGVTFTITFSDGSSFDVTTGACP